MKKGIVFIITFFLCLFLVSARAGGGGGHSSSYTYTSSNKKVSPYSSMGSIMGFNLL